MRHPIDESPRDGTAIILEDDARGTYDVAHWSAEAGQWLGENGEPTKITPTHWHAMPRDQYLTREDKGSHSHSLPGGARRFAAVSIILTLVAAAFIATYFRAEVAAIATRYAEQFKADQARAPAEAQQAAQERQTAVVPEPQHPPDDRALAQEPGNARPAIAGLDVPLQTEAASNARTLEEEREKAAALALEAAAARKGPAASTEPQRQALDEERAEAVALARERAPASRENEKLAAIPAAKDETTQPGQGQAAKSAQSLEAEKAAALALEAAAARKELAANTEQHRLALEEERKRGVVLARELAAVQRENETQATRLKAVDEAVQLKQAEAARIARALEEEREKAAAVALESAAAKKELAANAEQFRQAIEDERARGATLAREIAAAQQENEKQAARLKASDEAVQLKQAEAAKSAQAAAQEQQKTAALALAAAGARRELATNTEQQRQARGEESARQAALWSELAAAQREIEAKAIQLRQASEETNRVKQATEKATAELRQSLQQERDRAEAMARDLASARRTVGARVTSEPVANSPVAKSAKPAEVVARAQPTAGVQGAPEARLVARAGALLGQGNIGAARTVLERAVEMGSAQASFMLAETYDPGILSKWGTQGTRGEVAKARELYAKAHAGGIQEAKDRLNALRQ